MRERPRPSGADGRATAMHSRWRTIGCGALLWALAGSPETAAQLVQGIPRSPLEPARAATEKPPEGLYVMPWLAAGVVYDSNVLFAPRGRQQDDVFLRATPGLQVNYQSSPWTVVANYRFDSELYSKLHNLSAAQQRQFATLETRVRPNTNWTVNNVLGYAETRTPFELNFLTSSQAARIKTERFVFNPSTEFRLDSLNRFRGEYAYSKDIFGGNVDINSNIFNLAYDRRVGSHDTIGPAYVGRHFTFGGDFSSSTPGFVGGNPADVNSHAFLAAWSHDFAQGTRVDARAGPRFTNGKLDDQPEAFVGIRHRIPGGEVNLAYVGAITTVIGTVGATRTDSLTLTLLYEPVKHLTVTLSPTAAWLKSSAFTSTVYTAYVETAYQLHKYVTAKASAYVSYQQSDFADGSGGIQTLIIPRNVFWLRFEFTYPSRWE